MLFPKKFLLSDLYFALILSLPATSIAQSGKESPDPSGSPTDVRERLILESQRVALPKLIESATSPDAEALASQLSVLARDMQIAWLKRGLNKSPLPENIDARLSDAGALHRKKIAEEVGKIASLTLVESASRQDLAQKKSRGQGPRAGLQKDAMSADRSPDSVESERVRSFVGENCSQAIGFVKQLMTDAPCPLSPDQIQLSCRLDRAIRACLSYWVVKHPDAMPDDKNLLEAAKRVKQSLSDIADNILFQAILDPGEVEKFNQAKYASRGTRALLEPEVIANLGISRDQRKLIIEGLEEKFRRVVQLSQTEPDLPNDSSPAERTLAASQSNERLERVRAEADEAIYDLLTPSQIIKLFKMTGRWAPKPAKSRRQTDKSTRAPSSSLFPNDDPAPSRGV